MKFYLMSLWSVLIVATKDRGPHGGAGTLQECRSLAATQTVTTLVARIHKAGSSLARAAAYAPRRPGNRYAQVDLKIFFLKEPVALTNER